jgi:hypothetical protein
MQTSGNPRIDVVPEKSASTDMQAPPEVGIGIQIT